MYSGLPDDRSVNSTHSGCGLGGRHEAGGRVGGRVGGEISFVDGLHQRLAVALAESAESADFVAKSVI